MKLAFKLVTTYCLLMVSVRAQYFDENDIFNSSSIVNPFNCGIKAELESSDRIINGQDAQPGQWPWQVGLFYFDSVFCGGSLINSQWVLTAAHCTVGMNLEKEGYEIKLGISDLKNPEEWSRKIVPEKIFTNNYLSTNGNKFTMKNDIALIKLREPVEFSDYISPVCIATSVMSVPAGGELVWITGFGKTKVGSSTASFLQQTQIAISTLEQCDNALNFWTDVNRDEIICTEDTGSNTCNGDSGGPLVYQDPETLKWTQIGIVSFNTGGCRSTKAFTKAAYHIDWIKSTVEEN